jgi:hypothetical protein
MSSGEKLIAGDCTKDPKLIAEKKDYLFNTSSNLFLSVGGIPSSGWQVVGIQGIKSFDSLVISSFTADRDLAKTGPFDLWISPLDKRNGDEGKVTYPRFI